MTRRQPTPPPLSKTERAALDLLVRRGAGALNPAECHRLLTLWEIDRNNQQQERRTLGGAQATVAQLRRQLADAHAKAVTATASDQADAGYEGQDARSMLLNLLASWGMTTRSGSLAIADEVLRRHEVEVREVFDREHRAAAGPCAAMFAAEVYQAIGVTPSEPPHNSYTFEDDGELYVRCEDCTAYSDNVGDQDDARRWAEEHKADPYGERS